MFKVQWPFIRMSTCFGTFMGIFPYSFGGCPHTALGSINGDIPSFLGNQLFGVSAYCFMSNKWGYYSLGYNFRWCSNIPLGPTVGVEQDLLGILRFALFLLLSLVLSPAQLADKCFVVLSCVLLRCLVNTQINVFRELHMKAERSIKPKQDSLA